MKARFSSRHDGSMRELAAELIDRGAGWRTVARELAIPTTTAKNWVKSYRAVGPEVFLDMGRSHRSYDYETKLAAVRDHVEGGASKPDVMRRYGIASPSPLNSWVRKYREGGVDAALSDAPRGSKSRPRAMTREQELERRIRKLEAENAYLKKSMALKAAKRSQSARGPRP